jgi:hypothetical protein
MHSQPIILSLIFLSILGSLKDRSVLFVITSLENLRDTSMRKYLSINLSVNEGHCVTECKDQSFFMPLPWQVCVYNRSYETI